MLIVNEQDINAIDEAVKILKAGGIISFATETVYALACDPCNDLAVEKLYQLKKREKQKPIAILANNLNSAKKILVFSNEEEKIAKNFMPAALTLILKKKLTKEDIISNVLNNNSSEVGLRIPDHQFSLKLLNKFSKGLIAATSANISNDQPALKSEDVLNYFKDKIDLLIDGGSCKQQVSSTVIRVKDNKNIDILREGLIKKKQITNFLTDNII